MFVKVIRLNVRRVSYNIGTQFLLLCVKQQKTSRYIHLQSLAHLFFGASQNYFVPWHQNLWFEPRQRHQHISWAWLAVVHFNKTELLISIPKFPRCQQKSLGWCSTKTISPNILHPFLRENSCGHSVLQGSLMQTDRNNATWHGMSRAPSSRLEGQLSCP